MDASVTRRASLHLWYCGLQFPLVVQHQHCNKIQQQWERREALWSVKHTRCSGSEPRSHFAQARRSGNHGGRVSC